MFPQTTAWLPVKQHVSCKTVINFDSVSPHFLQAEMVHADIDSAIGDNKHGKKMRLQTLK